MRNAVRKLRAMTNKEEAVALYPKVQKMLDKLAKTNIIHKNKAANLKSRYRLEPQPERVAVVFCSFLADKLCLSDFFFVPLPKIWQTK